MLTRRTFGARAGGWLAWIATGCAGLASTKIWQTVPDETPRCMAIDPAAGGEAIAWLVDPPHMAFLEFAAKGPNGTTRPFRVIGICDDFTMPEISSLAQSSRPSTGFATRRENLPHQQAGLEPLITLEA